MGDPVVTVVIPTVRGGALLAEAVASALDQSVKDIEVVVVRNAPGVDLSHVRQDPRLRVLDEARPGRAYAVNRGASEGTGTWVALLDDDDTWEPDKLQRQLDALAGWDGVAASVTNFMRVDEEGHFLKLGVSRPARYADLVAARTTYLPSSLMVRRDLFVELGGLNPAYTIADDLDLFLRLSAIGDLAFADKALVHYRVHSKTMTQATRLRMWKEGARVISTARRAAAARGDWNVWRKSWRGTILFRRWCASDSLAYADRAWQQGDRASVLRHIGTALRTSPPDVVRLAVKRLRGRI